MAQISARTGAESHRVGHVHSARCSKIRRPFAPFVTIALLLRRPLVSGYVLSMLNFVRRRGYSKGVSIQQDANFVYVGNYALHARHSHSGEGGMAVIRKQQRTRGGDQNDERIGRRARNGCVRHRFCNRPLFPLP